MKFWLFQWNVLYYDAIIDKTSVPVELIFALLFLLHSYSLLVNWYAHIIYCGMCLLIMTCMLRLKVKEYQYDTHLRCNDDSKSTAFKSTWRHFLHNILFRSYVLVFLSWYYLYESIILIYVRTIKTIIGFLFFFLISVKKRKIVSCESYCTLASITLSPSFFLFLF